MLVLAVAGPVDGGDVEMTNLSWRIGEAGLRARGFPAVQLVNDYRALAASAGMLKDQDLVDLGSVKSATRDGTIAIIGAGTGLGVSALVREAGKSVAVTGEGGHIGFAPEGAREIEVLNILARRHGRVSAERIVSGPGLVQLYSALCTIAGSAPQFGDPPGIVEQAVRRRGLARDAVEMLCGIFGAVAGDAALFYGARGGVLISGGLSLALASFLKQGLFRQRFEGKGRLAPLVRSIPTRLIVRPDAALLGCAALARDLSMAN